MKRQRKSNASEQPAYGIRILYDDGDVANETFPGAGIELEPSVGAPGDLPRARKTAVGVPTPNTQHAAEAPEVGMRVKVKFDDGKLYGGIIARVKAKRACKPEDQPSFGIRILYDDGDVADETFPGDDIMLHVGRQ